MATKAELREEIAVLRRTGTLMANLCWNYAKREGIADRELMDELWRKWDAIKRREPRRS